MMVQEYVCVCVGLVFFPFLHVRLVSCNLAIAAETMTWHASVRSGKQI